MKPSMLKRKEKHICIRTTLLIALLAVCAINLKSQTTESISQNGITWKFDTAHTYGQFANGDYWVIGPVKITSITHVPEQDVDTIGTMVNPRDIIAQGYTARAYNYDSSLAVTTPFIANNGSSVVSVTVRAFQIGEGSWLQDAAVLTIVSAAPPTGSFRPPYTRPTRVSDISSDPLVFSTSNINWNLLPSLSRNGIADIPDLSHSEQLIERMYLDHSPDSFTASSIHPYNNMQTYGGYMARDLSEVSLQLMLDYSQSQKEKLCIRLIQIGIDMYGCYLDNGSWGANGGHASGRKFPIVFAAMMLNNSEMKSLNLMNGSSYRFGEDGQTYYYDDSTLPDFVNKTTFQVDPGPVGGDVVAVKNVRGWIGKTNGGAGDIALWRISDGIWQVEHEQTDVHDWPDVDRTHDNYWKYECYRHNCTSQTWMGYALAMRLMGPETITVWNHPAFFDYMYRYLFESVTNAQSAYAERYPGVDNAIWNGQGCGFASNMWNVYGKTYTPFRNDSTTNTSNPISEFKGSIPSDYSLSQNYPNPFNPSTKIQFVVPSDGHVRIRVYNCLGQIVATPFEGEAKAGQYQTVEIDGTGLSSGVYFYCVEHRGERITKQMALIK